MAAGRRYIRQRAETLDDLGGGFRVVLQRREQASSRGELPPGSWVEYQVRHRHRVLARYDRRADAVREALRRFDEHYESVL